MTRWFGPGTRGQDSCYCCGEGCDIITSPEDAAGGPGPYPVGLYIKDYSSPEGNGRMAGTLQLAPGNAVGTKVRLHIAAPDSGSVGQAYVELEVGATCDTIRIVENGVELVSYPRTTGNVNIKLCHSDERRISSGGPGPDGLLTDGFYTFEATLTGTYAGFEVVNGTADIADLSVRIVSEPCDPCSYGCWRLQPVSQPLAVNECQWSLGAPNPADGAIVAGDGVTAVPSGYTDRTTQPTLVTATLEEINTPGVYRIYTNSQGPLQGVFAQLRIELIPGGIFDDTWSLFYEVGVDNTVLDTENGPQNIAIPPDPGINTQLKICVNDLGYATGQPNCPTSNDPSVAAALGDFAGYHVDAACKLTLFTHESASLNNDLAGLADCATCPDDDCTPSQCECLPRFLRLTTNGGTLQNCGGNGKHGVPRFSDNGDNTYLAIDAPNDIRCVNHDPQTVYIEGNNYVPPLDTLPPLGYPTATITQCPALNDSTFVLNGPLVSSNTFPGEICYYNYGEVLGRSWFCWDEFVGGPYIADLNLFINAYMIDPVPGQNINRYWKINIQYRVYGISPNPTCGVLDPTQAALNLPANQLYALSFWWETDPVAKEQFCDWPTTTKAIENQQAVPENAMVLTCPNSEFPNWPNTLTLQA